MKVLPFDKQLALTLLSNPTKWREVTALYEQPITNEMLAVATSPFASQKLNGKEYIFNGLDVNIGRPPGLDTLADFVDGVIRMGVDLTWKQEIIEKYFTP